MASSSAMADSEMKRPEVMTKAMRCAPGSFGYTSSSSQPMGTSSTTTSCSRYQGAFTPSASQP